MDRVALQWVHDEIIERLGKARISLEEFAEGSGELSSMRDCAEILHEIRGVFEMLEFHSVSLLMNEMESLSQQVIEQRIERSDEACEVLMRGIAQLPEYMEYVRTGQRDNPILLMPLLNDLRSIRGESLLSESALFSPVLWVVLPTLPGNESVPDDESLRAELRRMRPFFQRGLVMWLTETEARAGSALMARVATRLVQFVGPSEARRLWWVAGAVLSALARGDLETNASLKRLVGRLDREIKALLDGGASFLENRPPTQLLKNLLYYVALARSQSVHHLAVREAFGLDGLLIALEYREGAARVIGGPSLEALRSVGDALKEDLSRVKDSLDSFVRNEEQPVSELTPQTDILNRVADTLGLLSLGGPRRAILNQAAAINRFRDGQVPPSHEELIEIARVLLNVDTTLDSLSEHGLDETMRSVSSVDEQSKEMSHGGIQLTGIEYLQLLSTVLAECKADLSAVKDAIATFVLEPDDYERLEEIPGRLYNVEGSLEILSLGRARELLRCWRDYVRVIFIERHEVPSPEMLDTLAETVISIEYYLDAVSQARPDSDEILERAVSGAARLVEATPADELRVLGVSDLPTEGDLGGDVEPEPAIPAFILEDLQRAKALLDRIEPAATQVEVDSAATESVRGAFAALPGTGEDEQDGEVDPEIIEVFLEEAEQIHVDLAVDLSAWAERPQNDKLLITVRRAFHTLKGSGRIVGAKAVADFAWVVENMLNRVIDRIVPAAPSIVNVTREAFDALPSLVSAFANPELETPDVSNLMSRAANLARPKSHTAEGSDRHGHGDVAGDSLLGTILGEGESAEILSFPARHEVRARDADATLAQARADTDAPAKSNAGNSGEGSPGEGNSEEAEGRRVLGAVFVEEATGHLDALEALLSEGEGDSTQRASVMHAPFMRIFHTLHGGARTAGMRDVANLAGALEDYLIGLRQEADNAVTPLGSAGLKLVRDAYHALRTSLHQRPLNEVGVVVGIEALLARIAILSSTDGASAMRHDATTAGRSSVELEDARDRLLETMRGDEDLDLVSTWDSSQLSDAERDELRRLFLEEAAELVDHADRTLTRWRANPGDLELVSALQRDIHTLKGGARVAGMNPVSDLSHALESVFMLVGERLLGASERLFDLLQAAHDRLAAAFDKAAANEPMPEVESLISALDGVVSPGVTDVDVAGLATSGLLAPVPDENVPDAAATNPAATHARAALGADASEAEPLDGPMELTAGRDARRDQVGVSADLLDDIVTHAGEISIAQGRVGRFVSQVKQNLEEMEQTVARLRDQLRRLEIETESQILFRHHDTSEPVESDFDPLELDRFSNIQELSRALSESVGDLSSIRSLLDELTRDSESLLAQQSRATNDLQQGLMQTRMLPFAQQVPRFRRIVRETARELSKRVELVVIGEDTQLDRTILSRMRAPLEHMLRNAVDHGIETPTEREAKGKPAQGLITLSLYRDGQEVAVKLVDDGAGMDRDAIRQAAIERGLLHPQSRLGESELLQLVLEPAISTSTGVTQISGRGVGMDVVNTEIKELGGTLQILSTPDEGTRFDIRLPFTLATNQALLVSVAAEVFALPLPNVEAVVRVRVEDVEALKQRDNPVFEHAGMEYPFVPLARLLGLSEEHLSRDLSQVPVILLRSGEHCLALLVEEQSGRQEVVVKPVGRQLASIRWITGATILGDGTVVLVLDVPTLVRMGVVSQGLPARNSDTEAFEAAAPARSVMVVDDSITVRRVTDRFLTRNGMRVVTAKDGLEALSLLQDDLPDLMLLDIEMPRMDGFELASTLRGDARTQALPIIMITSRTGKKHSDRARELGVDRYLGKPYHEVELLESINELLGAVVN